MRTMPRAEWTAAAAMLLLAGGLAAQCTSGPTVPPGPITSGTACYSNNNALSANAVQISGTASVSFIAGQSIQLSNGFQATAGAAPTTFHAWVQTVPEVLSVTPTGQSGLSGVFTFTVSSPSGYTHVSEVQALFNSTQSGLNGCYIRYDPPPLDRLYLAANDGSSWGAYLVRGVNETRTNSQCTIHGGGALVSGAGNQLAVTIPVTFQAAFAGLKNEYLRVQDDEGLSAGLQPMGTWTVPTAPQYTLTTSVNPIGAGTVTLSPSGGLYASGTVVTATAAANSGYSFTGWSGDATGSSNPIQITMNSNKSVTANFAAPGVQHTITSTPPGLSLTVDGVPCQTPCTRSWTPGSDHTVAAAFRQQLSGTTYFFSHLSGTAVRQNEEVWSSGTLTNPFTAQSSPSTYTASFFSDALGALTTCLGSSASSNCVLAVGDHVVTSTIPVGRSNVTIRGETSDRTVTHLRRGAAFTNEMMVVNVPPSAESLLIQNLTFCGESTLLPPGNGCPAPTQTTCGAWQAQIHYNWENRLPKPQGAQLCTDFTISQAGTLPRPDPFSGPYSVTISNSAFEGATGHAVAIYPNSPQEANDIYITGSAINGSEVTGLLVGVNGEDYGDHRRCATAGFLEDPSVHTPRNIRIDGNNGATNGFRHNFTGALGINSARWFSLENNVFDDNYHSPQGENSHGGTIFFDQCTDTVRIYGNTLTGPTVPYPYTEGMELWGRNIDVGAGSDATKNTITKYSSAGITLNSASTPRIRTNEISNIPSGPFAGGIVLSTRESEYPCMPSFRTTKNVTISGNASPPQIGGVVLPDKEYSTNDIRTIQIISSGTVALDPFVTLSGVVSITPAPVLSELDSTQLFPRAWAVQPFWDENAQNPGPIPAKCLDAAASSRQAFTFPVGDVSGADNIKEVEGTFTATVVDSEDPVLGPVNTAQACHFRFTPPADLAACDLGGCGTLDLAESVPDYDWGPWSAVGTGGVTIENSVCRIYAGSDKSKVTNTGKVLTLTLDIEFLNSTRKYMYAITSNKNDGQGQSRSSNGGTWRYWGWW